MLIDTTANNRLVIYFFYDNGGIVDDYNIYMLKEIMKNCSRLFVVSNGSINEEGKHKFQSLNAEILERENIGLDTGAYYDAMTQIGWNHLADFDEMILMNCTIMGPIFPFAEMFDSMDKRDLDFWGITKFHGAKTDPDGLAKSGYIKEHIQSHFITIRKSLLEKEDFRLYWDEMPKIKSYTDSIKYHEIRFTNYFAKLDYKWDVYTNTDDWKAITDFPLLKIPVRTLKEKRCPIIKRRSFIHDYDDFLDTTVGEPTYQLMDYIKNETDYDENLIWDNILRTAHQSVIKDVLQLNYILPDAFSNPIDDIVNHKKIALVMHLHFPDLLDESFKYASSMPEEADIYITTGSEKMKTAIQEAFKDIKCHKLEVLLIQNRGRDVSALLVACKHVIPQYDYVCFTHDKKVAQLEPLTKGAGWSYKCYENVLKNKHYVNNILDLFEKNPRLGLLTPPPPNHADYFHVLGKEWSGNVKGTKKLAKKLNLNVPIHKSMPPIAPLGSIFWFRPIALKKLFDFDWQYEDFPEEPLKENGTISHAIERIHPFVAQDAGYYPAWALSTSFASLEMTNLHYMLRGLNATIMDCGMMGSFMGVRNTLAKSAPAINSLYELGEQFKTLFPEPSAKNAYDSTMRLYYDEGDGFSDDACIISPVMIVKKNFSVIFSIPEAGELKGSLRFDPGEKKMIQIKKLSVTLSYADGTHTVIDQSSCRPIGLKIDDKFLFLTSDPQIYFKQDPGKRLTHVEVSGKISKDISDATMQKALGSKYALNNLARKVSNKLRL